jgi:IS30 family transposase
MPKNYHHLTLSERRTLYMLLESGRSKEEIARQLGRHRSTIYRELQRNTHHHEEAVYRGYFHVLAHDIARKRRQRLKRLVCCPDLREYIISKLQTYWSPDQIAGYLKRLNNKKFYACRETIYTFIYSSEAASLSLHRYLYKSFKKRRKRFKRKPRHSRGIPEAFHISKRPEDVYKRNSVGHWEGDLMIFKRDYGNTNLTTLVERKSRYCMLIKNQTRCSKNVMGSIKDKLSPLPSPLRRSITFDRGSEFLAWKILKRQLELGSYYCDSRSPWQKGTNENTNGRIRRFLPTDTNLNDLTETDLKRLSNQLNKTPRKCLAYKTPHEVFHKSFQEREG